MATYDVKAINTAIATTFKSISAIETVQDLHQLTENIPDQDVPLVQVYPDGWGNVSTDSETQQITFGGGGVTRVIQHDWTHIADVYISKKSRFGEAMVAWAEISQAVMDKLDALDPDSPFGSQAIRSFQYDGERVVINSSNEDWLVCRITIVVRIF